MSSTPRFDPSLSHQSFSLYKSIYEPSEDTFLLCDALLQSMSTIESSLRSSSPTHILEMGPGSGYCISYIKNMVRYLLRESDESNVHFHMVDINQKALNETRRTLEENGIFDAERDHFYHASLFSAFGGKAAVGPGQMEILGSARDESAEVGETAPTNQSSSITPQDDSTGESLSNSAQTTSTPTQQFDIIIFNPPYVPSEDNDVEVRDSLLSAWAGGERGRVIIDQFLRELPQFLRGHCFLLLERTNDVDEVREIVHKMGMSSTLLVERRVAGEFLYVLRIDAAKESDEEKG